MPQNLVTIGIAAFNAADNIEIAINSALNQDWKYIEIIIVDDASTDSTFDILQKSARKNSQIRVFQNKYNGGVAVTRNRILKEAKGYYVAFFDDDDESKPNRISCQVNRIKKYRQRFHPKGPIICHTARQVRYPNGLLRTHPTMGQKEDIKAPNGMAVAQRILLGKPLKDGNGACPTCSQMGERACYELTQGFDPQLRRGEDTDLNIRLAIKGAHFVGISSALVLQNMTKTIDKNITIEHENALLILEKYVPQVLSEKQLRFCQLWQNVKHQWMKKQSSHFLKYLAKLLFCFPRMTLLRIAYALPNLGVNRAFRHFHEK